MFRDAGTHLYYFTAPAADIRSALAQYPVAPFAHAPLLTAQFGWRMPALPPDVINANNPSGTTLGVHREVVGSRVTCIYPDYANEVVFAWSCK